MTKGWTGERQKTSEITRLPTKLSQEPTFAVLLIASLLVCPLRCLSCQAGEVAGADSASCSCCQALQNDDQSPSDEPLQKDDCGCPDCICAGATLSAEPEIPKADDFIALATWLVATSDHSLEETSLSRLDAKGRSSIALRSRDALVAYQSWLI